MTPRHAACLSFRPGLALAALAAGLLAGRMAGAAPDFEGRLVEVIATVHPPDARIPWRRDAARVRQGFGVVVGTGDVLTVESLVRHQTQLELRRPPGGLRLPATLVQADPERNLALLRVGPGAALTAVELADPPAVSDTLTLATLESGGEFQTSAGQVVELSAAGEPRPLVMKVLTPLNLERPGAPAFAGTRLAGLCYDYQEASQLALCLPAPALRAFLADARSASYKGAAWAGFSFEPLLDPAQRRFLGAPADPCGVVVTRLTPGSGAASVLRPGDVIAEWDGFVPDAQGYYTDPEFGRLHLAYLITGRRAPGDSVPVTVIRDRTRQTVSVPIRRRDERRAFVPKDAADQPVEYLVDGGLVLRPLTGEYLRAGGERWAPTANPRLVYYFLNQDELGRRPGDQVVLLAMVLPDRINVGYQDLRDQVVTAVNGRPVRCMADVFAAADAAGGVETVSLMGFGVDLVLDPALREEANRRVAAQYRIPGLRRQAPPGTDPDPASPAAPASPP